MNGTTFDTLSAARDLEAAGFNRAQAEALAAAIRNSQGELATKTDIGILKSDIGILKSDIDMLKWAVGINVDVVNHPRDTYWTEVWLVTPFNSVSWTGRPASQALSLPLQSTGKWNESHWTNPRFDDLLILASEELDFQKRKDYYQEMQEILIEEVPTTYAMYTSTVSAHWNHVYGVKLHPYTHIFYQDWWIER